MIDLVNLQVVGTQLNREIAVHRGVIEEIGFDHFSLVAKTENEGFKAVMGIASHDMPKDRMVPDRHHRLRSQLGFLAQPRAEAAAEYKDRNF